MDTDEISKDKETEKGINIEKMNRRSSILKPRKSINPLPDESTTEVFPTEKTRRVSFANINFVKPFAADPEKTTIWDNTYEEIVNHSDSIKGDTEGPGLLDATSITLPEAENIGPVVKTSLQIKETASSTKHIIYEIAQGVNECDKENAIPVVKRAVSKNKTVIFDTTQSNMEFTGCYANLDSKVPRSIVEFAKQQRLKQNLNFSSNVTDVAMEITCAFSKTSDRLKSRTEATCEVIGQSRNESWNTTIRPIDNMEFTLANDEVSNVMSTDMEFTTLIGNAKTVCNNAPNETVQNDDMEVCTNILDSTGAAPNRTPLVSNVSDTGMDFTCNLTRFTSVRKTLQTGEADMEFTTNLGGATTKSPYDVRTTTAERTLCQKPSKDQMASNFTVLNSTDADMEFTCNLASFKPTSTGSSATVETGMEFTTNLAEATMNVPDDVRTRTAEGTLRQKPPQNQIKSNLTVLNSPGADMEFTCNLASFKPTSTGCSATVEADMEFTTNLAGATMNVPDDVQTRKAERALRQKRSENQMESNLAVLNSTGADMEFTCNLASFKPTSTGSSAIVEADMGFTTNLAGATMNLPDDVRTRTAERTLRQKPSENQMESNLTVLNSSGGDMEFTCNLASFKPPSTGSSATVEADMGFTTNLAGATMNLPDDVRTRTAERTLRQKPSENQMENNLTVLNSSGGDMEFTCNLASFKPLLPSLPAVTRETVQFDETDMEFTTNLASARNFSNKENIAEKNLRSGLPGSNSAILNISDADMEFTSNLAGFNPLMIGLPAATRKISSCGESDMRLTTSSTLTAKTPNNGNVSVEISHCKNVSVNNGHEDQMESKFAILSIPDTDMEFTSNLAGCKPPLAGSPAGTRKTVEGEANYMEFKTNSAIAGNILIEENVTIEIPLSKELSCDNGSENQMESKLAILNISKADMKFPGDQVGFKPSTAGLPAATRTNVSNGDANVEFTTNSAIAAKTSNRENVSVEISHCKEVSVNNGNEDQIESKFAIPSIPDTDMEFTSNLAGFKPPLDGLPRKTVEVEANNMELKTNSALARNFLIEKNVTTEKPLSKEPSFGNQVGFKPSTAGLSAASRTNVLNDDTDMEFTTNSAITAKTTNREDVSVEISYCKEVSVNNGNEDQMESKFGIPSIPDADMEFTSKPPLAGSSAGTRKTVEVEANNMEFITNSAVAANSIKKQVTTEKPPSTKLSVDNDSENHMESQLAILHISDAEMETSGNLVGSKPSMTGLPAPTRKNPTGVADMEFTKNSNKENVSVKIHLSENISVSNGYQDRKECKLAIPSIPNADIEFTSNLVGYEPTGTRETLEAEADNMKSKTNSTITTNPSNKENVPVEIPHCKKTSASNEDQTESKFDISSIPDVDKEFTSNLEGYKPSMIGLPASTRTSGQFEADRKFTTNAAISASSAKKNVSVEIALSKNISVSNRHQDQTESKLALPSIPVADVGFTSNLLDIKPSSTDTDDKDFTTNLAATGHFLNNKQADKTYREPYVDGRCNNRVESKLPIPEITDAEDMEVTCDPAVVETGLPINAMEIAEYKTDTNLAGNSTGVANSSNYKRTGVAKRPFCRPTIVVTGSGNRTECATDSPIIKRLRGHNVSNENLSDELMTDTKIVTNPISQGEFAERVDMELNSKDIPKNLSDGTEISDYEKDYFNRLGRDFTTTPSNSFAMNFSMSPCVEDTQYLIHATFSKPESIDVLLKGQKFRTENMEENKSKLEDDGVSNESIDSSDNVKQASRFVAEAAKIVCENERQNKSCWDLTNTSDHFIFNTTPELVDGKEEVSVDEKLLPAKQDETASEALSETTSDDDPFDYRNYTMRCNKLLDNIKKHLVHIEPDPYFEEADKRCDELCARMAANRARISEFKKKFRLPKTQMIDLDEFFDERSHDDSSTSRLSDGFSADETGSRLSMADFVPPKPLPERVREAAERSQKYWQFLKSDKDCYYFNCLFGAIEFKVHVHPDLGIVYSIQTSNELEDVSTHLARYGTNVLELKLKQEHLLPALGPKFDVLALLDYVCLSIDEIVEFHKEFQQLEREYGFSHKLVMQRGNMVTFEIINVPFVVCWIISIDMSLNNVGYKECVSAKHVVGERVDEEDIKRIAENCTKGVNFLRNMIEKVDEYVQRVLRRLAFQRESKPV